MRQGLYVVLISYEQKGKPFRENSAVFFNIVQTRHADTKWNMEKTENRNVENRQKGLHFRTSPIFHSLWSCTRMHDIEHPNDPTDSGKGVARRGLTKCATIVARGSLRQAIINCGHASTTWRVVQGPCEPMKEGQSEPECARVSQRKTRESQSESEWANCSGVLENVSRHYNKLKDWGSFVGKR